MECNIFKDINDNEYIVPIHIKEGKEIAAYIATNYCMDKKTQTLICISADIPPMVKAIQNSKALSVILIDDKPSKTTLEVPSKLDELVINSIPRVDYTSSFIPKHNKPWYARYDKRKKRK